MTNVLIVDDEKIEREGLKYLLSREEGERTVFEAANGKQTANRRYRFCAPRISSFF